MTLLCLLLFIGAMGKSAQLGLHTWLPDAMEGPTPVSALIHAATMVTAGVFMVCRLSPMFETSQVAMAVVTYVGAATCMFAATVGTVQNDIKRVIAYSTCSQLGYMFFAAGVGAYGAAMFHLFTHAFFKALLFLGAGSVIHAMHHEQDMRFYGGLRKADPADLLGDDWRARWRSPASASMCSALPASIRRMRSSRPPMPAAATSGGRLRRRRVRRAADQLLFLAADVPDLLRQAALGRVRAYPACAARRASRSWRTMPTPRIMTAAHHMAPCTCRSTGTAGYHPHESPLTILIPLVVLSIGAVFAGLGFPRLFRRRRDAA